MSDKSPTDTQQPSAPFEHYCEEPGCKLWGGLGYEPIKGQSSYWCWEHFPDQAWVAARRREQKLGRHDISNVVLPEHTP